MTDRDQIEDEEFVREVASWRTGTEHWPPWLRWGFLALTTLLAVLLGIRLFM